MNAAGLILLGLMLLAALAPVALVYGAPGQTLAWFEALGRWKAGLKPDRTELADHRVHYVAGGQGPTLVLLHGFGAGHAGWLFAARHLTPHLRVIIPDLPGFGASSYHPQTDYGVDAQAQRLHQLVERLGLERFHLGGISLGGQIGAAYAARYPQKVRSLWLLAPSGVEGATRSELERRLLRGDNPLLVDTPIQFAELMELVLTKPSSLPTPILRHLARQAMRRHDANRRIFEQLMAQHTPLEERVRGLAIPTLIHWGAEDRVLHPSGADILGQRIADAEVRILPAIGHAPLAERPREVAQGYLRFLERRRQRELAGTGSG